MSTLFYILILILSTFFLWVSKYSKDLIYKKILILFSFLIIFLPSALRYDIGTDYLEYIYIYSNLNILNEYRDEPLFYLINFFLNYFNANFQWVFIIHAFIFTFFAFKSYPKEDFWVFHFVLMCFIYFNSFNIIRQAVSIIICLFALKVFLSKNTLLSLFFCFIATLFHKSAYFFIFFFLMSRIPVSDYFKIYIAPILFIFALFFSYNSLVIFDFGDKILSLAGFTDFSNYMNSSVHFIERQLDSGIGVILYLIMSLYISFNTKYILKKNPRYWSIIVLMMVYAIILVLSSKIVIFGRMVLVFLPGYVWAVYLAYIILAKRKISFIFISLFLIFLGLSFLKESFGTPNYYYDPKRVPYQTILKDVF